MRSGLRRLWDFTRRRSGVLAVAVAALSVWLGYATFGTGLQDRADNRHRVPSVFNPAH